MHPKKVPLASLPVVEASRRLTHCLTPDPVAKNPVAFLKLLQETPSLQRRARLLDSAAHFSYVSPQPLPFPFRIEFPEEVEDKKGFIEAWLSHREATEPIERATPLKGDGESDELILTKFTADERIQERELLGVAPQCVQDCLPQLDIGDALEYIGSPSLTPGTKNGAESSADSSKDDSKVKARQELLDVLSGHTVLASFPANSSHDGSHVGLNGGFRGLLRKCVPSRGQGWANLPTPTVSAEGYAPWSLRYSGHQFGQWAGQLGDGRAISLLEVPHSDSPSGLYELQLKGAGRTPFSRSADGLAVLRSSIREYLCAEAMYALGAPTTRSLALTYLPTLPVHREREERAAIVTRVAPSFIRIGSFQALNPPEAMFFLGGGQQAADLEALRILGEYVAKKVLKLDVQDGKPWAESLVMDAARSNALMVANWQAYGFMHGVINTDNVSIMGLTIDYGPYAFMDVYDPAHICNHSDDSGRYSFTKQPTMIIFALRGLLSALAPIIGAEKVKGQAVTSQWSEDLSDTDLEALTASGLSIQPEMEKVIVSEVQTEYNRLMRKRLGLRLQKEDDYKEIISPLLKILERWELDYSTTLRNLAWFQPELLRDKHTADLQKLLEDMNTTSQCANPKATGGDSSTKDWTQWLSKFATRIEEEKAQWASSAETTEGSEEWHTRRTKEILGANPRFILRQWILEEVIAKVEADPVSGRMILAKVLEMASRPFEGWGGEGLPEADLDEEAKEERRFCALGDQSMLGFQCSCSS